MGSFKVGGKVYNSMKAYRDRDKTTTSITSSVQPTTTTTIPRKPPPRGKRPEPKLLEKRKTTTTTSQQVEKAKGIIGEMQKRRRGWDAMLKE